MRSIARSAWPMELCPKLRLEHDAGPPGATCISIHKLDSRLLACLDGHPQAGRLLQAAFRVRVAAVGRQGSEDLPDVLGRFQVLETGIRFIPRFPFEAGVRYRASFDPRPFGILHHTGMLSLEFSLPHPIHAEPTEVTGVFPSADVLPENLLRFYVRFSRPMRRGRAEHEIRLLGPDGHPVPDVLYRPPLELWDSSMQYLTILLDPGRLKRWVGPNRELGPPLKAGQRYTLAIGAGMLDGSGRPLSGSYRKPFAVAEAARDSIVPAHWKVVAPEPMSQQPLSILFPNPLDWALLWRAITVVPKGRPPLSGRIEIDENERRWCFTPTSPWLEGPYAIHVAADLEDVCGNSVLGPFDRPLRSGTPLTVETADYSLPFDLAEGAGHQYPLTIPPRTRDSRSPAGNRARARPLRG